MAHIIGNAIFLKIGTVTPALVVGLTAKSINFNREAQEVTDQNSSGGWREYLPGYQDGKISVTGWYDEAAATEGAPTAFGYLNAGDKVLFKMGEDGTGKIYWSGSAYVSNLQINGNGSSPADYTFDLQITGTVSRASSSF